MKSMFDHFMEPPELWDKHAALCIYTWGRYNQVRTSANQRLYLLLDTLAGKYMR